MASPARSGSLSGPSRSIGLMSWPCKCTCTSSGAADRPPATSESPLSGSSSRLATRPRHARAVADDGRTGLDALCAVTYGSFKAGESVFRESGRRLMTETEGLLLISLRRVLARAGVGNSLRGDPSRAGRAQGAVCCLAAWKRRAWPWLRALRGGEEEATCGG